MNRFHPVSTLLLATVSLVSLGVGSALADSEEHWRLFIGDHTDPTVRAVDVEAGETVGSFGIDSYASLYRSESGRTVFAVQGEAGKVSAIRTGIVIEDHGDHADLDVSDAELLPTVLEGEKPSHFVEHDGSIAVFYDDEGKADLITERQVLEGSLDVREVAAGAPHHGLAAPMGRFVIHSVPNPDDPSERPIGLRVVDENGEQVGEVTDCPGLHGEAPSGRLMAFGCADGVVIASPGTSSEGPKLEHLATSADLGEGNVSTLKGGTALQFFLGNYGKRAVALIELSDDAPFRLVELPTRRVDFAVDPAVARQAYVLTEDGQLHLLNVLSGEIEKSVRLTEAYSMDGHWRDPRPRLAVAGEHIAVTDPLKGLVRLVRTDTFEEERTIPVEGTPFTIVAVGGSGAVH